MPYFIEDGSTPDWSENFSSLKLSKVPVVVPSVSNITELNLCNTQLQLAAGCHHTGYLLDAGAVGPVLEPVHGHPHHLAEVFFIAVPKHVKQ